MAKDPPRWYFSLRSPYSYLAFCDLTQRYPDVLDQLDWIPSWEPDEPSRRLLDEAHLPLPYVEMTRAKNFYILQDARRLAAARGLTLTWPVDRNPRWDACHLGYLVAQDAGRGRDYLALAYRARWEQGRDLCDPATIVDITTELGLPAGPMAGATEDPEVRRRGVDCLIRSCRDGVFGVPFFVVGRNRYFGVDRLRAVVAAVRDEAPPDGPDQVMLEDIIALSEPVGAGLDGGHAGGCG
jgi:2-hydroxychromene-2-carboxylate isomerase